MIDLSQSFPIGSHCRITCEGDKYDAILCRIIGHGGDDGLELICQKHDLEAKLAERIAKESWPIDQVIPLSALEELAMALENDESV